MKKSYIESGVKKVKNIFFSPKSRHIKNTYHRLDENARQIYQNGVDVQSLSIRIDKLAEKFEIMIFKQDMIQKQISELNNVDHEKNKKTVNKPMTTSGLIAENQLLDSFYTRFEDRFKNTSETKKMYRVYRDRFINSGVDYGKFPITDLGCGRGEFLEYMKDLKINAIGVDINTDMVKRAQDNGLAALQGDAINYLENQKIQSLGAITGFHIVEHLPFQTLLKLVAAAYSSLAPGGFALFETPNPENIIVATNSFYFDPSHIRPIPPKLLAFVLEVAGFNDIEIIRSYPIDKKNDSRIDKEIFGSFYGPRNYAVIGYK